LYFLSEVIMDIFFSGAVWYLAFLFSTTFHEAAHAYAALKLGDRTAYEGGQVTLDPIPHIRREPLGMVIVPLISFMTGGWLIGWASTPYDPLWAERYPRRAAWMSFAGPIANLTLVIAAMVIMRAGMLFGFFKPAEYISYMQVVGGSGGVSLLFATVLSVLFSLNLILLVFNLIPLPPLDGSGVITLLMSHQTAERYRQTMSQPAFSLIGLIIAWKLFGFLFIPVDRIMISLLYLGISFY
jgi:Zn-dependent protease